jgi:rhodanese-related sulfurtransferase
MGDWEGAIAAALVLAALIAPAGAADPRLSTALREEQIAPETRTTSRLYLTSAEAEAAVKAYGDVLMIDVRFPRAVAEGLPAPVSHNVPLYREIVHRKGEVDELVEQSLNPEFVPAVLKLAAARRGRATTIILICWKGPYSAVAAGHLTLAGFSNVYVVVDGTDGSERPNLPGWRASGLPWLARPRPEQIWVGSP